MFKKFIRIITTSALFLLLFNNLSAAETLILRELMEGDAIGLNLRILEDKKSELNTEDVLSGKHDGRFVDSQKASPGFGYTTSTYWLTLKVRNPHKKTINWAIEIAYPHLDKIEFYSPDDNEGYLKKEAGDKKIFNQREIEYRTFIFPLRIKPQKENTFYIRAETTSTMNLSIKAWTMSAFNEYVSKEQIVLGLYFGCMLIMCLYNFFIFISVRDISYLFYSIFIFFFILLQAAINGLAFQYIWPGFIWWANNCLPIFLSLVVASIILFFRSFLKTWDSIPVIDKILIVLVIPNVIMFFAGILGYPKAIMYGIVYALLIVLFLIITGIICLVRGSRPAIFFSLLPIPHFYLVLLY